MKNFVAQVKKKKGEEIFAIKKEEVIRVNTTIPLHTNAFIQYLTPHTSGSHFAVRIKRDDARIYRVNTKKR